jgi:predicted RNase H-like HicB family nuclease
MKIREIIRQIEAPESDNMRYTIILEHGPENFSAYAPDFPGCVAAASSEEEIMALMKEALEMHIEDMRERGETIPQPSAIREIEVTA